MPLIYVIRSLVLGNFTSGIISQATAMHAWPFEIVPKESFSKRTVMERSQTLPTCKFAPAILTCVIVLGSYSLIYWNFPGVQKLQWTRNATTTVFLLLQPSWLQKRRRAQEAVQKPSPSGSGWLSFFYNPTNNDEKQHKPSKHHYENDDKDF